MLIRFKWILSGNKVVPEIKALGMPMETSPYPIPLPILLHAAIILSDLAAKFGGIPLTDNPDLSIAESNVYISFRFETFDALEDFMDSV